MMLSWMTFAIVAYSSFGLAAHMLLTSTGRSVPVDSLGIVAWTGDTNPISSQAPKADEIGFVSPNRYGFATRPRKRIVSVATSRITTRNGRLIVSVTNSLGIEVTPMTTAVAAAASVPASSTATSAL